MVLGFRRGAAGQFWLRSLMGLQSNTARTASCSVIRLGLEDALPRRLTHMAGKWMLAIGHFLLFWIFPQNYLTVLPGWWLASPKARNLRERNRSCSAFYDPASEVTYCHSHHILLVACSQPWFSVRGDHTGARVLRGIDHLGHWRNSGTLIFLPTRCPWTLTTMCTV